MTSTTYLKSLLLICTVAFSTLSVQAQFCTGLTTLTAPTGTFTDGSGNSNYANNSNCTWLIQPPNNPANITLTMDSLALLGFTDAVRVYDGTSNAGVLVAIYRGTNIGGAAIANSGSMFVEFISNGFGNAAGWQASYISAASNCQPNTVLTSNAGAFTDGTRNGSPYANNTNCEWLIQPSGSGIFVEANFSRFTLASGDSLIIYDGSNATAPILTTLTSGNNTGTYQSSAGNMFVRFITDGSNTANGWRIVYNTQNIPACSGTTTLTSASGLFNDGSLPFLNYVENSNCLWVIQPTGAVTVDLNFNYFVTEANFDFVRVYEGTNNSGNLLGSFSGNTIPPPLTSTTGSMFVEFTSDAVTNSTGWEGTYTSSNTATISASTDTVYINAGSGSTVSFQLTANSSWTTSDNQNWLISTPINGAGNQTINLLALQGNIGPERTAELYINASNGNGGDTVTVIQRSSGRFLDIVTDTLNFTSTPTSSQTFALQSNVSWFLASPQSWITITPANGSNNVSPSVTLTNNTSNQVRSGYIVATGTQNAGNDTLYIQQDSATFILNLDRKNVTLDSNAGSSDSVKLTSNVSWTATTTASWLSVTPGNGSNSGTIVLQTNSPNNNVFDKSTNVIITGTNGLSDTISVTQLGLTPALTTFPDTLFLASNTGSVGTVHVNSTVSWITILPSGPIGLFTVDKTSGTGNDSVIVTTAGANGSGSNIIGRLIFSNNLFNLNTQVVLVQRSIIPSIDVNPDSILFAPSSGEHETVFVNSNTFWTASSSVNWLNLSRTSGTGNDSLVISTSSSNNSGLIRTGDIVFYNAGGRAASISVAQLDINSNFVLFSDDTLYLGNTAGNTADFSVVANNVNWNLNESAFWLQLNKTAGSATEIVTARAGAANPFGSPRYANVTATANGQPTRIMVVAQLGAALSFSHAPDSLIIGADSASFGKFNITSNLISWNATSSVNWLNVSPNTGSLTGEILLTANKPNNTGQQRSGEIIISSAPFVPLRAKVMQDTIRSIGINEELLSAKVQLYPNPSVGEVHIKFPQDFDIYNTMIEVRDMLGKSVSHDVKVISREHLVFDFTELNNGIYFVQIQVGKARITKKVLLVK